MVKLVHIYSLLILGSLLRLAEREDQIKSDENGLKAEHLLLDRIRNLVQLAVAKLRATYSTGYELMSLNGSLAAALNEFEKLKKEFRSFLYIVDSKRHALFNHKYRLLLAQINILIEEIPRFEIETFDNSSFYQRLGLCFLSICNSLCRFFSNLECSISKLEEVNRKIDKLQMIANEFRYLTDKRRPGKNDRRKLKRRRGQIRPSEQAVRRRRDQFLSPGENEFRRQNQFRPSEGRRRAQFRLSEHEARRRQEQFRLSDFRRRRDLFSPDEDDFRVRRDQFRLSESEIRRRRGRAQLRPEPDARRRRDQFSPHENEFRRRTRKDESFVKTKKSRQKPTLLQTSSLHRLVNLISYHYVKYGELVDRLFSFSQDYWDILVNKLNDFLTAA